MFSKDINASTAAELLRLKSNTINGHYNLFREVIFKKSLTILEKELGIFEADESYFGARRVRGLGGRGAAGKTTVLAFEKRWQCVRISCLKLL